MEINCPSAACANPHHVPFESYFQARTQRKKERKGERERVSQTILRWTNHTQTLSHRDAIEAMAVVDRFPFISRCHHCRHHGWNPALVSSSSSSPLFITASHATSIWSYLLLHVRVRTYILSLSRRAWIFTYKKRKEKEKTRFKFLIDSKGNLKLTRNELSPCCEYYILILPLMLLLLLLLWAVEVIPRRIESSSIGGVIMVLQVDAIPWFVRFLFLPSFLLR